MVKKVTSQQAVEAAMDEFDKIGRDAFLEKYNFGKSLHYFVMRDGKAYDSKAIYGVAHGIQFPDYGAVASTEFPGGEHPVKNPLEALGYEFRTIEGATTANVPSAAQLSITSEDVRLIASSRSKKKYAELSEAELAAYLQVSGALEGLGNLLKSKLKKPEKYKVGTTSGYHTKSGVRGSIPKDLWFSVTLAANAEHLAGIPQLFMIVSERGIEYGYGASVSPQDFSNMDIKNLVRAAAPIVFDHLPKPASAEAHGIQGNLESDGAWFYRRKHRLPPKQQEFSDLNAWLEYLQSDDGKRNAAGCISGYLLADDVDGTDLAAEISKMARLFQPLMDRDWHSTSQTTGLLDLPIAAETEDLESGSGRTPTVWIEKTLVKNRQDRQTGPDRLGEALWSPQKSRGGGDIYASMRQVKPGDIVLHLTDNTAFTGVSQADQEVDDTFIGLPHTDWAGQPGYRIQLRNFRNQDPELPRTAFLTDNECGRALLELLDSPQGKGLFYNRNLDLNQGAYLSEAPPALVAILNKAYFDLSGRNLVDMPDLPEAAIAPKLVVPTYTIDDALNELFLEPEDVERYLDIWSNKKNLILQGAPGVGKSFIARRLAYALIGFKDDTKIQTVQFHQSYSYEDFVQGYRPNGAQGFDRKNGSFYEFRDRALRDPDSRYVFIIDEINRGNLSKIFGELMLLIEPDKRGPLWKTRLAYASDGEPDFYVPENLFILGMMNTADRSLSLVDYALRRRFAFVAMAPLYGSSKFRMHLEQQGIHGDLVTRITSGMAALNQEIEADRTNLGPGFRIGHSFFTPSKLIADPNEWHRRIVETEIHPLLEEYWFDAPEKADDWRDRLLS
ncbi:AAA family ATPase [Loktanella sp. F6476L]|uniref:AAA family ATPase n=1 Tax=Loktanella sp. F6476L TaxID=2926405 RepID=UPI001FF600DB|nr:AAA family ATPase [Loktanella sp. F6476L]MCK0122553.1 AAA family ATPase [Loktanella sp. F6476L]